ncbi:arylsulfatase [Daejeonella sp.]|uniref:arylsulfatase n=1 Tax=Daejeonella sp. TaxID=2805397 RepID=UPI0030BFFB2A
MKKINLSVLILILAFSVYAQKPQPNIVVIMADDMGFSDLGSYGSEISTPNIDRLAEKGIRLRQFYNTGRCCPTRASLLTGLYPHNAGMGYMTGFDHKLPGYKGDLNMNALTIAEALKPAGYSSYMAGKWHVSSNIRPNGSRENWPVQRGFDRYFGILQGSASYFTPKTLTSGNTLLKPGAGFYLTDAIADSASAFIKDHASSKAKSPFFLYVAYTAPHWPLHAKEEDIQKYMKLYEQGWDKLRDERYKKQLKMGILDGSTKLSSREDSVPAWKDIPSGEKGLWVKRMAVYAAQVDCMDQGVGRITKALQDNGLSENTMVIFLSDNGGCAEYLSSADRSLAKLGNDETYESYRGNWANLSNTPFRLYKTRVHEGGVHTPFIVSWPGHTAKNGSVMDNSPAHLIDLMPTFLEAAGAKFPAVYNAQTVHPLDGVSLLPVFTGKKLAERNLHWEHEGNRAIRVKDWKLVSKSSEKVPYAGSWELYDLAKDKTELNDLAAKYPVKVKEMEALWTKWANQNNVLPINGTDMTTRGETFKREY